MGGNAFTVLENTDHASTESKALVAAMDRLPKGDWDGLFDLARSAMSMPRVDKLFALSAYATKVSRWRPAERVDPVDGAII